MRCLRPGFSCQVLSQVQYPSSCPGPPFVHWVMLKLSDVSPALSALGPGVQLIPRVAGGAREKEAGLGHLGLLRVPAPGPGFCGPSPIRVCFSPGPVRPVLLVTTLPLRPAAVPEAGGAASAEKSGPGEGHGGAGRACGHAAL